MALLQLVPKRTGVSSIQPRTLPVGQDFVRTCLTGSWLFHDILHEYNHGFVVPFQTSKRNSRCSYGTEVIIKFPMIFAPFGTQTIFQGDLPFVLVRLLLLFPLHNPFEFSDLQ